MSNKKEAVPEVSVQEQPSININKLRIKSGLEPIQGRDVDLVSVKHLNSFK